MGDHARGRILHAGATAIFRALWCNIRGGKEADPYRHYKKVQ
jgi:hypothetical protein